MQRGGEVPAQYRTSLSHLRHHVRLEVEQCPWMRSATEHCQRPRASAPQRQSQGRFTDAYIIVRPPISAESLVKVRCKVYSWFFDATICYHG